MKEHKKQPKQHKRSDKYDHEQNRMDYEGGNYGESDSTWNDDQIEGEPVRHKTSGKSNAKRGSFNDKHKR